MEQNVSMEIKIKSGYYSSNSEFVLAWVREHNSLSPECHKIMASLDKSIIYYFAAIDDYQGVKDLMAAGVSVDIQINSQRALVDLINLNHIDGVKTILKLGSNPNLVDYRGVNALWNITNNTSFDIIQNLVQYGADFSMVCTKEKTTALIYLCHVLLNEELNLKILDLCHGANLDFMDNDGNTALKLAMHSGKLKVVKRLVEMGASLKVTKERGFFKRNLHFKALDVAKKILKTGVDYPPHGYGPQDLQNMLDYIKMHNDTIEEKKKLVAGLNQIETNMAKENPIAGPGQTIKITTRTNKI